MALYVLTHWLDWVAPPNARRVLQPPAADAKVVNPGRGRGGKRGVGSV